MTKKRTNLSSCESSDQQTARTFSPPLALLKCAFVNKSGATAVEAAITLPFLLALTLATIEGGRLLYTRAELAYAVHNTARYAMVMTDASPSQIKTKLDNELILLNPQKLQSVSVTEIQNGDGSKTATLNASYDFGLFISYFGNKTYPVSTQETFLREGMP